MLASYHNLFFLHQLVLDSRIAIRETKFMDFKKAFLYRYRNGETINVGNLDGGGIL